MLKLMKQSKEESGALSGAGATRRAARSKRRGKVKVKGARMMNSPRRSHWSALLSLLRTLLHHEDLH
jgi:hypothetical protein